MATRKHTNTRTYTRDSQWNHASVGLAQARPNKGIRDRLQVFVAWCCTLTSTATFVSLARHPASCYAALSKVFSKHLQVY